MSLDALRAGIRWDFESLPQYLDMLERQGCGAQHRPLRRPFVDPHLRDGRRPRRSAPRRADEIARDERAGARGDARRRGRLRHAALRPRTTARAARRCPRASPTKPRCARWSAPARGRARRVHADQGRPDRDPLPRGAGARIGAPGGDRRAAAHQHQPDARVQDLDAIAQANARGHRLVGAISCCPLSMDFTLQSPYLFEGMRVWKPALAAQGRGLASKLREPGVPRRGARGARAARRTSACSTANGTRCTWSRAKARTRAGAALDRRARREGGRIRSTACSTSRSREPRHRVQRAAAQLDEAAVGAHAAPPAPAGVAVRRRRAPHLLLRRRLRPAPARPLGARARRAHPAEAVQRLTGQPAQAVRHPRARRACSRATPPT